MVWCGLALPLRYLCARERQELTTIFTTKIREYYKEFQAV